jgi:hypothetical protein
MERHELLFSKLKIIPNCSYFLLQQSLEINVSTAFSSYFKNRAMTNIAEFNGSHLYQGFIDNNTDTVHRSEVPKYSYFTNISFIFCVQCILGEFQQKTA